MYICICISHDIVERDGACCCLFLGSWTQRTWIGTRLTSKQLPGHEARAAQAGLVGVRKLKLAGYDWVLENVIIN